MNPEISKELSPDIMIPEIRVIELNANGVMKRKTKITDSAERAERAADAIIKMIYW